MSVKILFINQPNVPFDDIEKLFEGKNMRPPTLVIPLGILWLSSCVKKHDENVQTHVIDYAHDLYKYADQCRNIDELIAYQLDAVPFEPAILAFSAVFSASHMFLIRSIKRLKEQWPSATVIVGGNHATNATEHLLENPDVDFVARGEAEISFSEFVKNFSTTPHVPIQGIYSKEALGNDSCMVVGEYVEDLDEVPFPDWDLIDMEVYTKTKWGRGSKNIYGHAERRTASIMTTRGCPFSCTFCASHTTSGRKMRYRSVENVITEIDLLNKKFGVNIISAEDDLFTANRKKVIPLLKAIRDKKNEIEDFEFQFPNGLSVNTLFDDVMDGLIECGTTYANIAIESGSEYVQRKIITKNCNLKRAKEVVKYLRDRGVTTRCYFVLGFPGETREFMQETVDFAKEIQCDWAQFSIAVPLRGTVMHQQFIESGCVKDNAAVWGNSFIYERNFDTPEIGAEEMNEFVYRANLEVNFFNNPNFLSGNYSKSAGLYKEVLFSFPFHIIALYCLMKCHEAMGEVEQVKENIENISRLIGENDLSREMYSKYGEMMKDFTPVTETHIEKSSAVPL